jgi:hypothetical protein
MHELFRFMVLRPPAGLDSVNDGPRPPRDDRIAHTGALRPERRVASGVGDRPWLLSATGIRRLSRATRDEIARLGLDLDAAAVPEISAAIERELARAAADVYVAQSPVTIVPVGSGYLTADTLATFGLVTGMLPLTTSAHIQEAAFRELGIADLLTVREELRSYRAGEIAHVENVLHGESKERTHRRLNRRIETITTETEQTETTERDLQSTERFELQRETQQTVSHQSSFDVGVTVKYGGFVDVEASTNYASQDANQLSTRAAMNYAREVVDRSVSRIQERVHEQQVVTTLEEIEETNVHRLSAPSSQVVGIYRWLDKVQDVQVLNYGKRTMLELIIPEPAAFTLFARGKQPPEGVTLEEPRPPTYGPRELTWDPQKKSWVWRDVPIEPLLPHHLQWWNYQQWVAQYGADVEPPPQQYVKKSFTWQSPKLPGAARGDAELAWEAKTGTISVDAGYAGVKAYIYAYQSGRFARDETWIGVSVGEVRHPTYDGASGYIDDFWYVDLPTQSLTKVVGDIPITITAVYGNLVSVVVEVLCERTDAAMEAWRQKAYSAIVTAYQNLRSLYDEQLAAALTQAGIVISGRNPGLNREVEQAELKREAITLLAHRWWQHLEGAGSLVANRTLYPNNAAGDTAELPEIDFGRWSLQAPITQFLEQALEWTHMAYTFYPYFWARKSLWPLPQQLEDPDPIHARFLRAGAARLLVPIRPGYEQSLRHYSLVGDPWPVTLPTTLDYLQQDAQLPTFPDD